MTKYPLKISQECQNHLVHNREEGKHNKEGEGKI